MFNRLSVFSFLCLLAILLTGCVKNEFKVDAELPASVNDPYRLLYYASDPVKGWVVETVLAVEKGKGELTGMTRNPTLVYVFTSGSQPRTFFYAERGDVVKISGKDNDPLFWSISGNKINEELTRWRGANKALLEAWRPLADQGTEALNKAVAQYVTKNPENPVSVLLLLEYYDRRSDEEGFRKTWKQLKGNALDGKWRELVSRSDMLADIEEDALPQKLVLQTVPDGLDTIEFGKVPVLLFFTRSNVKEYQKNVGEMKEIAEASSDSASRVIANILLEPDSMLRVQNARRDTLPGVVEGWIPLGLSDSRVRNFGIGRIPYAIVVDNRKKIVYRGDDLQKARLEFKKLTHAN